MAADDSGVARQIMEAEEWLRKARERDREFERRSRLAAAAMQMEVMLYQLQQLHEARRIAALPRVRVAM